MKIEIEKQSYHDNKIDTRSTKFLNKIIKDFYNNFDITGLKGWRQNISNTFKKYNDKYTNIEKEECIKKIILGTLKTLQDKDKEYDESHIFKEIKNNISNSLPFLLENEKKYFVNSYFFHEPRNIYCLYLLNELYDETIRITDSYDMNQNEKYYIFLFVALIRSLRSSLILLSIGDDVHAASIIRGSIELMSRGIALNDNNIDTYIEYIELNRQLQNVKNKQNTFDDFPKLKQIKEQRNYTTSMLDQLFLNGWYKNSREKEILTNSDLIKETLGKDYISIYKNLSEFVHEDYIMIPYNYIDIRYSISFIIYSFTVIFIENIKDDRDFKITSKFKTAYNLFNKQVSSLKLN